MGLKDEAWRLDPAAYRLRLTIPTRYGDMDANAHLNNVAIARLFEESRVRFHYAIRADGGTAIAVQGDVANEADILAMFQTVDAQLGRISALVNNAGVVDVTARVDAMSTERLRRMFDTNVIGSIVCAREAVRRMSARHGGSGGAIVNVSSAASRLGSAHQYVDYAAAKGAIDTFTIGLAREVAAEGIRVNAVRPGLIETDIHASGGLPDRVRDLSHQVPMLRGGTADEVAEAIVWLMSPAASYTTATLMDVSGGR